MQVRRLDRVPIQQFEKRADGSMIVPAFISRTGVQIYRKSDGSIFRELRLPEEVFDDVSLDSFKMVPVTNNHPQSLVNVNNAKFLQIGITGENIEKSDGRFVKANLMINDVEAIKDVENGKQEISCGYTCVLDMTPGNHSEFGRYDAIQREIRGNHVAVVDKGRAGTEVCIRSDALDGAIMVTDNKKNEGSENLMKITLKIDGKDQEIEVSDDAGEVINSFVEAVNKDKATIDESMKNLEEEKDGMKKKADEIQSKLDAMDDPEKLKIQLETKDAANAELQKKVDAMPEQIKEQVKNRMSILDSARKYCDEAIKEKLDDMSDLDLQKSVITQLLPEMNLTGKSDSDVSLVYEMTIAQASAVNLDGLGSVILDIKKDNQNNDGGIKARSDMKDHYKNNWKKKD